jgi:hypothetical protein
LRDRRARPGDANWERDAYVLAAARAHARAIEIDRRAARLLAAAASLRTKGADTGVAALLAEESVAPWTLGKSAAAGPPALGAEARASQNLGSDRAARRFCDRLVELGALRERTGRPTFRRRALTMAGAAQRMGALYDPELADLPPEMRWREWMGRVEAAIFAAAACRARRSQNWSAELPARRADRRDSRGAERPALRSRVRRRRLAAPHPAALR